MRISVSGTANTGKTTLIRDFNTTWPDYTVVKYSYRDVLKSMPHSKSCTQETQWLILNSMIDEMQKYSPTDHVIYDRCPLDNLVYSLWAFDRGEGDIDQAFIDKCIPLVRESMKFLDIAFFIPLTKASPIAIVDNGTRETDPVYIEEIDNLFKAIINQYHHHMDRTQFFPKDDCPGVIEVFGQPQERIYLIKQYLDVKGDLIGAEGDSILNPDNLEQLAELLEVQKSALASEKFEQQQINMVKDFVKKSKRKR
jgi:AAA domain